MALVLKDRVQETTATTGTGTVTLAGAVLGYVAFSTVGNGNTTYYCIVDNVTGDWETGIGTYTLSGTTLSRDTVYANSAGTTAKISFGAGNKTVFGGLAAERMLYLDASLNASMTGQFTAGGVISSAGLIENNATIGADYTVTTGNNAVSAGPVSVSSGITVTVPAGSVWTVV